MDFLIVDKDTRQRLLKYIRVAPDRQWIETYFDLIKEIIETVNLDNDDPRFVISMPNHRTIAVTINQRYVLEVTLRKDSIKVGFIVEADYKEANLVGKHYRFRDKNNLAPPYFCYFESIPTHYPDFKEQWKKTIIKELARGKASSFKSYHRSLLYYMATDPNERKKILDKAYNKA